MVADRTRLLLVQPRLEVYAWLRRQPWLYDVEHDSLRWQYRRLAHILLRRLTRLAALRYWFIRPPWHRQPNPSGRDLRRIRLNLGSGKEPLPDWINVDINPFAPTQVWMDLRDRWPFAKDEVQAIYMRHCLEHFTEREVQAILAQCYRVLQPGGGMRIGVPSLTFAMQRYQQADFSFAPWVTHLAQSPGRQFFLYMMDNGTHGIMFDYGYVAELLILAGFQDPRQMTGGHSSFLDPGLLAAQDNPADCTSLYVECQKG